MNKRAVIRTFMVNNAVVGNGPVLCLHICMHIMHLKSLHYPVFSVVQSVTLVLVSPEETCWLFSTVPDLMIDSSTFKINVPCMLMLAYKGKVAIISLRDMSNRLVIQADGARSRIRCFSG